MPALKWSINGDHFSANTEFGTYKVGDWGGGKARVSFPGGGYDTVAFDEGKAVAQAHYDMRLSGEVAA